MKKIAAFFKLIRWPNLLFIIITQLLFFYCIYMPIKGNAQLQTNTYLLYVLIFASVCIAAAGYVINDYFDIQIDAINKPNKVVINNFIKRRWAIVWHWILSGIGVGISIYVGMLMHEKIIFIVNGFCVVILWFYSTYFKKKILVGNVIIAMLTAWVILVIYFYVGSDLLLYKAFVNSDINNGIIARKFFKVTMLFVGFAFITTIIREVIKDLEDMEGDRRYGCNTMPIAWGVPVTKVFVAVWILVAVGVLATLIIYAWLSGWWLAVMYLFVFLILPFCYLLYALFLAKSTLHFHQLSRYIKLIMLTGILSMALFYYF